MLGAVRSSEISRVRACNLAVAQHAGNQIGIARVPRINLAKPRASRFSRFSIARQGSGTGSGSRSNTRPEQAMKQAALVRKMGIERVSLHAGPLGDHADRGQRRSDAPMQFHGRLYDPSARLGLLLRALRLRV